MKTNVIKTGATFFKLWILLFTCYVSAQSNLSILTGNETSRNKTYPVDFVVFKGVTGDSVDAVIHYPSYNCYSILVKITGTSDSYLGDYANRDFNSKCNSNKIIRVTSIGEVVNYESIEINHSTSQTGLKAKSAATGELSAGQSSPLLNTVLDKVNALKSELAVAKNTSPKFSVNTFPKLFYKKSDRCDPYTGFFNCKCLKDLADLKTCKVDKIGFDSFLESEVAYFLKQQKRSYRKTEQNIELSKACFKYHGAKALFDNDYSGSINNLDIRSLVKNAATRTNGRGSSGPCTSRIIEDNAPFPDPYEEYSQHFTNWDTNPNFPKVSIPQFRNDFKSLYNGWLSITKPFNNVDILGLKIGMDIENVYDKFPVDELKKLIAHPYRLQTKVTANSYPSIKHPIFNERLLKISKKPHFKYLAAQNSELTQRNQDFMNMYLVKTDDNKQQFANVFQLLEDVFGKPYKIQHRETFSIPSKYPIFNELNIKEVEFSFNQFQQLNDLKIVRRFEGLVDLNALRKSFEEKYQVLDLKLEESVGTFTLGLFNDMGNISFRVNHRSGDNPYTEITYSIETYLGDPLDKNGKRAIYLEPILDKLIVEYLQKNKPESASGITI
jgi:hypothetical protein